ncbi:hypothetical protein ACQ33O_11665 [Ferruginibacter sp. SUN002]|uniref:hypothetical protein n=1 Tax=Ferruginibacter sp. SUN002 TaxID=2937789 RepID=UPI003D35B9EF
MHKYLFFLSILMVISLSAISQSNPSEEKVKTMLCHKWKAVSIEVQGEKELPEEDLIITFLIDGTFIDSQEGTKPNKEKWEYNHEKMTITTGDVKKKILTINEHELRLSTNIADEIMIVTLKRVD